MNQVKICLDRYSYFRKPSHKDAEIINNSIAGYTKQLSPYNINDVTREISLDGYSFCPATFKDGKKTKENFEQQQLFVLSFNGGISFKEVAARAKRYGLFIQFAYETYDSRVYNRCFNTVFLNDVPVDNLKAAEIIQGVLLTVYPEADRISKDITTMFHGGVRERLVFNEEIVENNIESLIRGMSAYLFDNFGETHYKKKIAKFAENYGISLNDKGLLSVKIVEDEHLNHKDHFDQFHIGKKMPKTIILSDHTGKKLPKLKYQIDMVDPNVTALSTEAKEPKQRTSYRPSDLKKIESNCQLLSEFCLSKRKLTNHQFIGLATNVIFVESGSSKLKNILSASSLYDIDQRNFWSFNLSYLKQNEDEPWSCDCFCPYADTCQHGKNILSTANPKTQTIERLSNHNEQYYPIDEVFEDVRKNFYLAIEDDKLHYHVIKAQTSVGKTEIYLEYLAKSQGKVLIDVPTNILKHDVLRRALKMKVNVMETPSLDEIKDDMPPGVWEHIEKLRAYGRHSEVTAYIKKQVQEKSLKSNTRSIENYLLELEKFKAFDGHVITTHQRLLYMNEAILKKYEVVIIDEDIIAGSIIPNHVEVPVLILKKLLKNLKEKNLYPALAGKVKALLKEVRLLKDKPSENLFRLPSVDWDNKEELEDMPTAIDISSFCSATHFYYRKASEEMKLNADSIVFLRMVNLKPIKHIILSATVDETVCSYYFGDEMKFYNCKRAEYLGTLNQYYNASMSRAFIDEHPKIYTQIKEFTGNDNVITFKEYNKGKYHFGNTAGCDTMKGQNIDVIGTYHLVDFLYKLFPYTLGIDFDEAARLKPRQAVTHNGYRFKFTTYDDEVLRNMQFWMIESELEQAVGRARLLRCDCTVNLFSNFPLLQANLMVFEYDKSYD